MAWWARVEGQKGQMGWLGRLVCIYVHLRIGGVAGEGKRTAVAPLLQQMEMEEVSALRNRGEIEGQWRDREIGGGVCVCVYVCVCVFVGGWGGEEGQHHARLMSL